MRKNSIKGTRINAEVLKELSSIISNEVKDPRIHPFTTVTAVEITPDLKYGKVFVSVLGSDEDKKNTLLGLKSSAGFIRTRLAHTVNLRNTPELTFELDESIEYGINMSKKISEVISADEAAAAGRETEESDGDED